MKGISESEKRSRIIQYFHESASFYLLKELEKSLHREKGIKPDVVKELLDGLVADGLVQADKIGISNYYWSFPAQAQRARQCRMDEQQGALASEQKQRDALHLKLTTAASEREDNVVLAMTVG